MSQAHPYFTSQPQQDAQPIQQTPYGESGVVFRPDKQQQQQQAFTVASPSVNYQHHDHDHQDHDHHDHDHDHHGHSHDHHGHSHNNNSNSSSGHSFFASMPQMQQSSTTPYVINNNNIGSHHFNAVSPSIMSGIGNSYYANDSYQQYNSNNNNSMNILESKLTFSHLMNNLMRDNDAKKLAIWIVVMFCFTIFEIVYGAYLESLGLVSDGFHALFDCIGFMISLTSILVGKKGSNREFTYGYDRWEILGVFSNSCFLLFVCIFLFLESVERLLEPPHIHDHGRVISLAFLSLLINITGILFFRKHSSVFSDKGRARQENFITITSHIFADSCTSVGVIFSTLVGSIMGVEISDSLISFVIALIIVYDVLPISIRTGKVLLQTTPEVLTPQIVSAIRESQAIAGVISINDKHFWTHSHGNYIGSIVVTIREDSNEQQILRNIKENFQFINNMTIQIEKEHNHGHGHSHGHSHSHKHKEHDHHDDHDNHDHNHDHHDDHDDHDHHDHHDDHDDHHDHHEDHDHHGHSHNNNHHGHSHDHHGHSHNH